MNDEQVNLAPYQKTLEAFLASSAFYEGLVASTRASWGGSGYSVELFEDGDYRVLWNNQIGNLYHSAGIILGLPTLDDNDLSDFIAIKEKETGQQDEHTYPKEWEDEYFALAFANDEEELKQVLREGLLEE